MSAAALAIALGGLKVGSGWTARCLAHNDRKPSLSICDAADGKVLVHCHAGCEQAQVIDALRSRGLWADSDRHHRPQQHRPANEQRDRDGEQNSAATQRIWGSSTPAIGTLAEAYLRTRSINIALPPTIRFRPGLKHPSGHVCPAMVALVTHGTNNRPIAIHRTFLTRDGTGKAPVDPPRMALGSVGGGAVRLGTVQPGQWLAIGEGIETTLSVMQACALPGWAALSAAGMRNLILPPDAAMVLICADNDANGTGQRAARDTAERFLQEGRRVRIAIPPVPGSDFNDVLNPTAPAHIEGKARHVA